MGPGAQQEPEEEDLASCLSVLCAMGTLCVETEQGAMCLPIVQESSVSAVGQTGQAGQTGQVGQTGQTGEFGEDGALPSGANPSCAATLCAVGSRCIDTGLGAVCVPFPEM
jgi:hypothetical protein